MTRRLEASTGSCAMSEPPSPHPALYYALLYSYHIAKEVYPIGDDLFSLLARFKYGRRGLYTSVLGGKGVLLACELSSNQDTSW